MRIRVSHRLLVLLITILSCLNVKGQDKEIFFDAYEWNFSSINESDGAVSHVFYLMNNSSSSVRITGAIPGCSCIMAVYPKEDIAPGKIAPVEVFFTPSGSSGKTFRTIEIVGSRGKSLGTLSIQADVTPSDQSIQRRYPSVLTQSLYVSKTSIPFGYMTHGQSQTKLIYIANAFPQMYRIEVEHSGSMLLDVNAPEYLASEKEQGILLTYTMPKDKSVKATYNDTLWVKVNGVKASKPIVTSAVCLEKAPSSLNAPSLRLYPSFGELKKGYFSTIYSGEVELSNVGKSPLIIEALEKQGDCETSIKGGESIPVGGRIKFSVKTRLKSVSVNIFTNDPERPYRQIIFKTR